MLSYFGKPRNEIEDAGWDTVKGEFFPREPNGEELWGKNRNWFSRQAEWDKDAKGQLTVRALLLRLKHHYENVVTADVTKLDTEYAENITREMKENPCDPPMQHLIEGYCSAINYSNSIQIEEFEKDSQMLKEKLKRINHEDKDRQLVWVHNFDQKERLLWADFYVSTLVNAYFKFVLLFAGEIYHGIQTCLLNEKIEEAIERRRCLKRLLETSLSIWIKIILKYSPSYIRIYKYMEEELRKVILQLRLVTKNMLRTSTPPNSIQSQTDIDQWHVFLQRQFKKYISDENETEEGEMMESWKSAVENLLQ